MSQQDENNPNLKEGDVLSGFTITKIVDLSKLNNKMYQLEHEATGASMIHLSNTDDNNCLAIGFKTTPLDSTGVAHILEHTALCGSKKYPVRDPFFNMIKRSMKTYMNAMTASDWTMYPIASQNETDFYNLVDVYLDATFFPLLDEANFRQEGHRIEFAEEGNQDSPLSYQGIVYNEMKGAMSSQSTIMYRRTMKALFPTITYKNNSGGEPSDIPELTWKQLVEFHRTHYHPSNAYFYTYGNLSLQKHLEKIEKQVLSQFEKIEVHTGVPNEQRYGTPQKAEFVYPLNKDDDDGKKSQVALSWLACKVFEPLEVLGLQLIEQILLGDAAAPLRKNLLESNLGKGLADTTGYESEVRETYFSAGLQGVAASDADQIEEIILSTLKEIVSKGIDPDRVESAVHQMELETREISGGHTPYGLNLLFRFFDTWIHGGDPLGAIDFDENMETLRKKIVEGPYLEGQIQKFLLDNPHRVRVILSPDSEMEGKEEKRVQQFLQDYKEKLSQEEKEEIVREAQKLKNFQEQEEDLSCLPPFAVEDIPKKIKGVFPMEKTVEGIESIFYDQATNGLLYLNWYFRLEEVQEEDREWFPLFGYLLTKMGANGKNYEEMAEKISLYTGGFSSSPSSGVTIDNSDKVEEFFTFSGKGLVRNREEVFGLAGEFMTGADFSNVKRMKTLIAQRANALQNSIVQSGHRYALGLASRHFNRSSELDEIYGGVRQLQFMRKIAQFSEEELGKVVEKMNQLKEQIFCRDHVSMLIVGEKEFFDGLDPIAQKVFDLLPEQKNKAVEKKEETQTAYPVQYHYEAWTTTTPVSYIVSCFKTVAYLHPDSAKLLLLSSLMQNCFLHSELREKGGAYGGMAGYNPEEGIFYMLSYRDPNLSNTINVYQDVLEWAKEGNYRVQDVEEAIIDTCSRMDSPLSPAGKAISNYHNARKGKTLERREQFRTSLLNSTKEDLIEVAKKYFNVEVSIAAVTSEEIVDREKGKLKNGMIELHSI